ncbi:unnamed protein product [Adineta steineri]|uniref:Uncharacterized protein n=1 Tax=Adineta steineri TaxID=433720 RepID=A0A815BL08_9BILA|nr:unnamed protein product [Adineta steineri]CAF1275036.1 unnamed protein product [Adineta steineri]CAF3844365.1 unnamed protein product [Adineta steineri]CAF4207291.1 unnamed protein product [Adineta steineri]
MDDPFLKRIISKDLSIADLHRLKDETGKILASPNNDSKVGVKYNLLQSILDYVNHSEKPVINAAGAPVNGNSKYMVSLNLLVQR